MSKKKNAQPTEEEKSLKCRWYIDSGKNLLIQRQGAEAGNEFVVVGQVVRMDGLFRTVGGVKVNVVRFTLDTKQTKLLRWGDGTFFDSGVHVKLVRYAVPKNYLEDIGFFLSFFFGSRMMKLSSLRIIVFLAKCAKEMGIEYGSGLFSSGFLEFGRKMF